MKIKGIDIAKYIPNILSKLIPTNRNKIKAILYFMFLINISHSTIHHQ